MEGDGTQPRMSRAAAHGQPRGLQMNGSGKGLSEDWLSLIIGIVIFVLSLGLLVDRDLSAGS